MRNIQKKSIKGSLFLMLSFMLLALNYENCYCQLTNNLQYYPFSEIEVLNNYQIEIVIDDKYSVTKKNNSSSLVNTSVEVVGRRLIIKNKVPKNIMSQKIKADTIVIHLPIIEKLIVSGTSEVFLENIVSDKSINVYLSNLSNVHIVAKKQRVNILMSGRANCLLEGDYKVVTAFITGSSILNALQTKVDSLELFTSGNNKILFNTVNYLYADIIGKSLLKYKGSPIRIITVSKSSFSIIDNITK